MSNRDWLYLTGTAFALFVLWLVAHKTTPVVAPQAESPFQGWNQPMDNVYNSNPQAYLPPDNVTLTVNVGNQTASMLSDAYMPLFGFVGIAQGEMFQ